MAVDRPIPHWRQGSRRWAARAGKRQTWPQRGSLYQAGTQSLTKTPWDSGWLTSARRVAARDQLPRRDIGHTGEGHTHCHPGHRVPGTREVIRQSPHLGDRARQAPGRLSCSDLGRAKNTGQTESAPLWTTQETEPEWLRPRKCTQPRAHLR